MTKPSHIGVPVILNCFARREDARDSYIDLNEALLSSGRGDALTRTNHSWIVRVSHIDLNGVSVVRVASEP